jgi:hypothetical protein
MAESLYGDSDRCPSNLVLLISWQGGKYDTSLLFLAEILTIVISGVAA